MSSEEDPLSDGEHASILPAAGDGRVQKASERSAGRTAGFPGAGRRREISLLSQGKPLWGHECRRRVVTGPQTHALGSSFTWTRRERGHQNKHQGGRATPSLSSLRTLGSEGPWPRSPSRPGAAFLVTQTHLTPLLSPRPRGCTRPRARGAGSPGRRLLQRLAPSLLPYNQPHAACVCSPTAGRLCCGRLVLARLRWPRASGGEEGSGS